MADMLVTPEELASWLKQDLDNRPTVELILAGATGLVQAAARQRLVEATSTASVLGGRGRWLELPERPINTVDQVLVDGVAVTDWKLRGGRLWRRCGWWRSSSTNPTNPAIPPCDPDPVEVDVTYAHGWPTGHFRLEYARTIVLGLAGGAFITPSGVVREQIDDYAVAYDAMAARMDQSDLIRKGLRRAYGLAIGWAL